MWHFLEFSWRSKYHRLNDISWYILNEAAKLGVASTKNFQSLWSWPVWGDFLSFRRPFGFQCTTGLCKLGYFWIDVYGIFSSKSFHASWIFFQKWSFISALYPLIFVNQVFITLKAVSWNFVNWLVFALWAIEINVCFFVWLPGFQFWTSAVTSYFIIRKSTEIVKLLFLQ